MQASSQAGRLRARADGDRGRAASLMIAAGVNAGTRPMYYS